MVSYCLGYHDVAGRRCHGIVHLNEWCVEEPVAELLHLSLGQDVPEHECNAASSLVLLGCVYLKDDCNLKFIP